MNLETKDPKDMEVIIMNKPVLVIMAAGMGSRYGGLKQLDPVDNDGHIIMDFSIYDAVRAGFEKVIFIIKRENEQIFRETIGKRAEGLMEVAYVFQELENIPDGFTVPEGRIKPWGTGHAVLACSDVVSEPFLAINADDFYGSKVYKQSAEFLGNRSPNTYALAGYKLKNTLSKNGGVSRGICSADSNLNLMDVREFTGLEFDKSSGKISSNEGEFFTGDEFTSLNFWSFSVDFMKLLERYFDDFMKENSQSSKAEFYLPSAVGRAVKENAAIAKILPTDEIWQGVTYREDVAAVEEIFKSRTLI